MALKVKEAAFSCSIDKVKYDVSLTIFKPQKYMMYRAELQYKKGTKKVSAIHVLYEVKKADQRFAWFDEAGKGKLTAKLAKVIERRGL